MNLELMRVFVAIAELGSQTRAADVLDTAQSIVSRHLSTLEREVGGRLFHRNGRGVELSPLGEALLPKAIALIRQSEEFVHTARAFEQVPSGTVRIGMLESFTAPLVSLLFQRMRHDHPGVALKIYVGSTGRIQEWLDAGEVDLSLNLGGDHDAIGDARRLCAVDTFLVGRPGDPLLADPTIPFAALDGLPLVLGATQLMLRGMVDAAAARLRIAIAPAIEVDMLKVHLDLAATGSVYALATPLAFMASYRAGRIAASRIVEPAITRNVLIGTSLRAPPSLAVITTAAMIQDIYGTLLTADPELLPLTAL